MDDLGEFGLGSLSSMAGVGTAVRGSKIDSGFRHSTAGSLAGSVSSAPPQAARLSSLSPKGPRPVSGARSISNSVSSDADVGHASSSSSSPSS